jgi:aarF domain-containing kinase
LVDTGKLKLDEKVATIWPEFRSNNKEQIKVHHVLNHTSGLHNALASLAREDPLMMCNWDECLRRIAMCAPETEPGSQQNYHYMSYGWLCGGIIEHTSGKKFQEILEEAIIVPLKLQGEMYIGIPPGVESRLATLSLDADDLRKLSGMSSSRSDLPSSFQSSNLGQVATTLPSLFNTLNARRAILPSVNGHCSARALARYYATLVDSGTIPPPHHHYSTNHPTPLGSHPQIPKFTSKKSPKKRKGTTTSKIKLLLASASPKDQGPADSESYVRISNNPALEVDDDESRQSSVRKIFGNERIHDEFLGVGEYEDFVQPNGKFGLGFRRITSSNDGSVVGFGHSGIGGSTAFCDIDNRFSIAVTLNKMSFGGATREIVHFVCSQLNIPVPHEFLASADGGADDMRMGTPLIN